jgi:hypothetical protein
MTIPKTIPTPMLAFAVMLRPEDCASTVALRVLVAEIVGFVTAVFGVPCRVSIFCYESIPGKFALVEECVPELDIWTAT